MKDPNHSEHWHISQSPASMTQDCSEAKKSPSSMEATELLDSLAGWNVQNVHIQSAHLLILVTLNCEFFGWPMTLESMFFSTLVFLAHPWHYSSNIPSFNSKTWKNLAESQPTRDSCAGASWHTPGAPSLGGFPLTLGFKNVSSPKKSRLALQSITIFRCGSVTPWRP